MKIAALTSKLNISFAEFLAQNPAASKRLANAVLRALDEAYVPIPTVLEYWENQNAAYARMYLIDGLGKKTIGELDRLILDFLRSHGLAHAAGLAPGSDLAARGATAAR